LAIGFGLVFFAAFSILEQLVEFVPRKLPVHLHSTSLDHGPVAQLYQLQPSYLLSQIIIPAIILFMQPLAFRTKLIAHFPQSGLGYHTAHE
jgi:hypothetical protein